MVVDPSQLRISVEVPGSDIAKISKDSKIEFLPALSEKTEEIVIEGISPLISPVTRDSNSEPLFQE